MGKLRFVAACIGVLLAIIIAGQLYLRGTTGEMIDMVAQTQATLRNGGSDAATKKLAAFTKKWERERRILPILLNHNNINAVNNSAARLPIYLKEGDETEFNAECALIRAELAQLWNVEQVNWENIL